MMPEVLIDDMRSALIQIVAPHDSYGVVQKLLFAHSMRPSPEGVLRIAGFVHLYGAAGIHLYAILDRFDQMIRRIQVGSPRPLQWVKLLFFFCLFLCLWGLQDFRFGFLRPFFLMSLRFWARGMGFRFRLGFPLLITALMDLMFEGFSTYSGRFHYYAAVGGGLFTLDAWRARNRTSLCAQSQWTQSQWVEHAVLALGSWIFIAVVELYEFRMISIWTPLISLLTIPVLCGIFYPLLLLGVAVTILGHSILLVKVTVFIQFFLKSSVQLIDATQVAWLGALGSPVGAIGLWFTFFLAVIFSMLIRSAPEKSSRNMRLVLCIFFVCVLRLTGVTDLWFHPEFLVQWNVGQGDAMTLFQHGRMEWLDVGGKRFRKIEDRIHQLTSLGVNRADAVLLGHLDEDHIGGFMKLSAIIPVTCVETHDEHWKSEKGKKFLNLPHDRHLRFVSSRGDGSCLRMIQPTWHRSRGHGKGNELMAGVRLSLGDEAEYWALGDGDYRQEEAFYHTHCGVAANCKQGKKIIWKVGHHGSRFSTSPVFLNQLQPTEVWVSVGKNRYRHPHPDAMGRIISHGTKIKRTDRDGDLILLF